MEKGDDQMELPPGFRFHPTDEELITHYLSNKVGNNSFIARAIGEVDLNKCEPWDLPLKAKMGGKQWYFFCVRDRKYPTGLRTNRATEAGYWKATGKDKEIYRGKTLIGMKKTLVFYKGRAPKGEKTNWVMHEYRLEGKISLYHLSKSAKNEWVICRVFEKNSGGKKTIISGQIGLSYCGEELGHPPILPPLMDSSNYNGKTRAHVSCFSNSMEVQKLDCYKSPPNISVNPNSDLISQNPSFNFSKYSHHQNQIHSTQYPSNSTNFQCSVSGLMQDQTLFRALLENNGSKFKQQRLKTERDQTVNISHETGLTTSHMNNDISSLNHEMGIQSFKDDSYPSTSAGPVDLDCLWNY